jgi:hypothetical protein
MTNAFEGGAVQTAPLPQRLCDSGGMQDDRWDRLS